MRRFGRTTVCLTLSEHDFWIGRGRFLIGIRDHRRIPPLFSERYRHTHTKRAASRYGHIGPWCFHFDNDWMTWTRKEPA